MEYLRKDDHYFFRKRNRNPSMIELTIFIVIKNTERNIFTMELTVIN